MIQDTANGVSGTLARRLVAGAGLRVGSVILARVLGVARVVVFARIFLPEQIGVAALAVSCVSVGAVLADPGVFQNVLRARDDRAGAVANTAFAVALMLGIAVVAGLYLAAPLLSDVFRTDMTGYIRALGILVLAVPLQFPRVYWQRQLRFGHPSAALLIAEVANFVTAVIAQLMFGLGVWSLVTGHVVAHVIAALYIWFAADTRPRFEFRLAEAGPLAAFGAPLVLYGLNGVIMDRADNMMVGGLFGTAQLAYYDFAWQIPLIIASLAASVDSMLLPLYARVNDDPVRIADLFSFVCKLWSIVGSFFCLPLILFARDAVMLLYGPAWLPAAPFLQIMAASFLIRFCTGYAYDNLVLVRGRTLYLMKWGLVNTALLLTIGFAMIRSLGPIGGAWYWMLQVVVLVPLIRMPLILKELGTLSFLRHVWQPPVAAAAGAAGAVLVVWLLPWRAPALILAALLYTAIYAGVMLAVDRGFARQLGELLRTLRSGTATSDGLAEIAVARL